MTDLMKRYEAETGNEVQSDAFAQHEIWEYIRWLESQLTEQTLEKFQEIIRTQCDEISALKAKLRWRSVSEKPEKEGFYLAKQDTTDEPFVLSYKDNVWQFFDYDIGEMVITSQPVSWLPIPPQGE